MAVIRTLVWILLVCGLLIFSFYNWHPVEVTIWENLVLETKVPMLVLMAFALGFAPLLAYHLSVKWALKRRVRNLENSLKTLATSRRSDTPAASASGDGGAAPLGASAGGGDRPKPDTPDSASDGGASDGGGDGGGGD